MKKDYEKMIELLKEIKELVEKTFPNNSHQQGLVYYNLNHSYELKEWKTNV